jgi:type I restriction enzyme S subunit
MVESELGFTSTGLSTRIPEGWNTLPLYETAEYINGSAFKANDFTEPGKGLPIVKIVELKQGIYEGTKYTKRQCAEKYLIDDDEVLYSWSGSPETSLEVFKWFGGKALLNQHIFRLIFQSEEQKHFTYYLLRQIKPLLVSTAKQKQTTGLGHITVADMKRIKLPFPTKEILHSFSAMVKCLYEECSVLEKENKSLRETRDSLLPELLSGEIELNAIHEGASA